MTMMDEDIRFNKSPISRGEKWIERVTSSLFLLLVVSVIRLLEMDHYLYDQSVGRFYCSAKDSARKYHQK